MGLRERVRVKVRGVILLRCGPVDGLLRGLVLRGLIRVRVKGNGWGKGRG